jgi:hypothetical protein
MTTPATNLTFSSIQAELGGSNPISLSEYTRGGSIVNTNQTSPNGTIPASLSNISMGVFRSVTKSVSINNSLHAYCESTDGTVAFSFNDNGTMYYYDPAQSTGDPNWATPTTAGIGPNYWVKITRVSGVNMFGMTSGTLYPIGSNPYVPTAYYYVGVGDFQASTGNIDIYLDSGGTTRVGGGTYSMSVINQGGPGV